MTFSPSCSEIIIFIRCGLCPYHVHIIGISLRIRRVFNPLKLPSHVIHFRFAFIRLYASIHQSCKVDGIIICIRPVFRKRFRRSGAETILSSSCTLGYSCINTAVRIQIHGTAEVRKEQTALHSPVTALHDKAAGSHIIQKKRIATCQCVIISVSTVSNNRTHINTFPFLTGSLRMCLCLQSSDKYKGHEE